MQRVSRFVLCYLYGTFQSAENQFQLHPYDVLIFEFFFQKTNDSVINKDVIITKQQKMVQSCCDQNVLNHTYRLTGQWRQVLLGSHGKSRTISALTSGGSGIRTVKTSYNFSLGEQQINVSVHGLISASLITPAWRVYKLAMTNRAFTHDDRYDDRFANRFANQASKHCLRIWPRPLACLRRRICSLQMEEVNTF